MFSFTVFYMHKCTKHPNLPKPIKKFISTVFFCAKFKKAIEHELK